MTTLPTTDHQMREYLCDAFAEAQTGGVAVVLTLGRKVYECRQASETTRGGTEFTAKVSEWTGKSRAAISTLSAIGARESELFKRLNSLPNASAVGLIAVLPDDEFDTVLDAVAPDMTTSEVKDLIREVRGLPAPQKREPIIIEGEVSACDSHEHRDRQRTDNPVLERYLKGELERTKEQLEQRDKELERARVTIKALEERPAATPVEATRSDERLQAALDGKDRIIAGLHAERDAAIAEAAALRKQIEAMTKASEPKKKKPMAKNPLPKEGTFSARDILRAT
jgi:hypothetical protein